MAHDTHHQPAANNGPKTPLGSAFWFVLVLVILFISSVNFVNVMSHDEGGHGTHAEATHEAAASHEATHEAAATHEGAEPATADTAHHAEAH